VQLREVPAEKCRSEMPLFAFRSSPDNSCLRTVMFIREVKIRGLRALKPKSEPHREKPRANSELRSAAFLSVIGQLVLKLDVMFRHENHLPSISPYVPIVWRMLAMAFDVYFVYST
jgi:hypothetical protein